MKINANIGLKFLKLGIEADSRVDDLTEYLFAKKLVLSGVDNTDKLLIYSYYYFIKNIKRGGK